MRNVGGPGGIRSSVLSAWSAFVSATVNRSRAAGGEDRAPHGRAEPVDALRARDQVQGLEVVVVGERPTDLGARAGRAVPAHVGQAVERPRPPMGHARELPADELLDLGERQCVEAGEPRELRILRSARGRVLLRRRRRIRILPAPHGELRAKRCRSHVRSVEHGSDATVGRVGIEPTTRGLKAPCSATELTALAGILASGPGRSVPPSGHWSLALPGQSRSTPLYSWIVFPPSTTNACPVT